MSLNVAFVQVAANTTNGATQNIADANTWSGLDVAKVVLVWMTAATTNDTATANAILSIGMTDNANTFGMSTWGIDANSNIHFWVSNTTILGTADPIGGAIVANATVKSLMSNGIAITWNTAPTSAYLINALILGGSDLTANVVKGYFANASVGETITVNHSMGVTPDSIMAISPIAITNAGQQNPSYSGGFYDVVHSTYATTGMKTNIGAGAAGSDVFSNCISTRVTTTNTAVLSYVTLASIGPTSFNMVSSSGMGVGVVEAFITLKINSGVFNVGVLTANTNTGTNVWASSLSGPLSGIITLPVLLTAIGNTYATVNFGLYAAANNNGITQQGGGSIMIGDTSNPIACKSQSSNTVMYKTISTAGATTVAANLSSWNSNGLTANFLTAGSAWKIPFFAFGKSAAAAVAGYRMGIICSD